MNQELSDVAHASHGMKLRTSKARARLHGVGIVLAVNGILRRLHLGQRRLPFMEGHNRIRQADQHQRTGISDAPCTRSSSLRQWVVASPNLSPRICR